MGLNKMEIIFENFDSEVAVLSADLLVKILKNYLSTTSARNLGNSTSKSSFSSPAMFSLLSSAQLLSFL